VWLVYLQAGIFVTGEYFVFPSVSVQKVFYNFGRFSVVVAVVAGVRLHRRVRSLRWYVLAFGMLVLVIGEVIFTCYENVLGIEAPFLSIADAFYLLAMPCLADGLVLMHRRRVPGRQWAQLIDASIEATVGGMLSWIFLMKQTLKVKPTRFWIV
jgi:hypothetical protein